MTWCAPGWGYGGEKLIGGVIHITLCIDSSWQYRSLRFWLGADA